MPLTSRCENKIAAAYTEHAPALLAYARSLGLDAGEAQDVLHHVFLKLIEQDLYPDDSRPYLFRAVRNGALNRHRSRTREEPLGDSPWFFSPPDCAREVELRRAILALPEDQSEALVLHIWGGLTFLEIATVTGVPTNTAASRYRYALASLKRSLQSQTEVR